LTPKEQLLTQDEMVRLVTLFSSMGVEKVRLTGGEPLVRDDIVDVTRRIREEARIHTIGMTTNGVKLPRLLGPLVDAGLTHLNVSLDTLQAPRFERISRRPQRAHAHVMDAIAMAERMVVMPPAAGGRNGSDAINSDRSERNDTGALLAAGPAVDGVDAVRVGGFGRKGLRSVKLNCVVMRDMNEDEIPAFVALTQRRNLEVRFIEFMPFESNKWERKKMLDLASMMDAVEAAASTMLASTETAPLVGHSGAQSSSTAEASSSNSGGNNTHNTKRRNFLLRPIPAAVGDTARSFTLPGHAGRIGFISSMTSNFCATCNRLRLTADGQLKVCLFGEGEADLRGPLRAGATDAELREIIRVAVGGKKKELGGHGSPEGIAAAPNRPMIHIGG
jgi:cyclic pyranopterin phosphate synthase